MEYVYFLAGVIFGAVLVKMMVGLQTASGVLRIDQSNLEKDLYLLEINSIEDLSKKKRVVLKVDKNANLTQK